MKLILANKKMFIKILFFKLKIKTKFDLIKFLDNINLYLRLLRISNINIKLTYNLDEFDYKTFLYLSNLSIILNKYANNIKEDFYISNEFNYFVEIKVLYRYLWRL